MSAFSKINLADLPAPTLIVPVDFEAVLADLKADLIDRHPEIEPLLDLESSPLVKLLQVAAYRETILISQINQSARAVLLATATGTDIDNLAALVPLARLVGESDANFRRRVQLAPEGFSTAGPAGAYEFHARSVSTSILDVTVDEPAPGTVHVYIMQDIAAKPISAALIAEVKAALSDDQIRPLTDLVDVKAAILVDYDIDAQLTIADGPDSQTVLNAAIEGANIYVAKRKRFGANITRSGLLAAIHVAGVENVDLVSPAADIAIPATSVAWLTGLAVAEAV